ncbi:XK-related protein 7-like [Limulus polyphemus]|uniref:XK-related protein n=1 Tax=Limulus polyphemus TaxID=6850 RepID=A0ABM1SWG6_LIMPO|nr:XK-related protein 7-like [Limulus polyphemus]
MADKYGTYSLQNKDGDEEDVEKDEDCTGCHESEMEHHYGPSQICCIPLPRLLWLFVNFVAPTIIFLLSYVSDIVSDAAVSARHYADGNIWWFALTLSLIFTPAIMFALFGILKVARDQKIIFPKKLLWILFYAVSAVWLIIWPLFRYLKMLYYGFKILTNKTRQMDYIKYLKEVENEDAKFQKVFKAFLESAPQLLLQLYILLSNPPEEQNAYTVVTQVVGVSFSLISLTNVVTSFEIENYQKRKIQEVIAAAPIARSDMEISEEDEKHSEVCCVGIEFLWWFFSIGARVIALAMFGSVYTYWLFLVCGLHVLIMSTFILVYSLDSAKGENVVLALFMGFIYIFCFVEYKVNFSQLGKIAALYILYYILSFTENTVMILLAYFTAPRSYWFHPTILICHFVGFFLGVVFMLFYLGLFRPFHLKQIRKMFSPVPPSKGGNE